MCRERYDETDHRLEQEWTVLFIEVGVLLNRQHEQPFQILSISVADLVEMLNNLGERTDKGVDLLVTIENALHALRVFGCPLPFILLQVLCFKGFDHSPIADFQQFVEE